MDAQFGRFIQEPAITQPEFAATCYNQKLPWLTFFPSARFVMRMIRVKSRSGYPMLKSSLNPTTKSLPRFRIAITLPARTTSSASSSVAMKRMTIRQTMYIPARLPILATGASGASSARILDRPYTSILSALCCPVQPRNWNAADS